MKKWIVAILAAGIAFAPLVVEAKSSKSGTTSVRGYTKKDGTRVAPHKRTTPDKSKSNNWSSKGNSNPYTGKPGSK